MNLVSAVCGALTVLWVARILLYLFAGSAAALLSSEREEEADSAVETDSDPESSAELAARARWRATAAAMGAVAASGLLCASLIFFRQATVAEVYVPTAAVLAATLFLFAQVARGAGRRAGLALAMVAGLGLALHPSFRMLMALPIAALMIVRLWHGARWPLVTVLLALGVGAATHSYLPLRSAVDRTGAVDWGHPDSLPNLVDHAFTAKRIRTAFDDEIMSVHTEVVARNVRQFSGQVHGLLGPIALVAAAAGLFRLGRRRRDRWLVFALVVVAFGDAAYSVWINPMGLRDLQNGVPLAVAVAIAAGAGVTWLAQIAGRAAGFVGAVAALVLILPPGLARWDARWAAAAGELPRRWSEAALESVGPRGLALPVRDSTAAGLIFLTSAEGARPDIAVLVRQHLADLTRNRHILGRAEIDEIDPDRVKATLAASRRPIAWELGSDRPPATRDLRAGAPMARLVSRAESSNDPAGETVAALAQLVGLFTGADAADPNARNVYARALNQLGLWSYRRGGLDAARTLFRAALAVRSDAVPVLVNLGVVAGRQRRFAEALAHSERALALEPTHVGALVNAARFCLRLNRDARAERYLERAFGLDETRASAWELAGLIDARRGNLARARARLERALTLDPHNAGARELLQKLPPAGR